MSEEKSLMSWISEESDAEFEYAKQHSHSKVVRLTPKDAQRLLKLNTHNRKIDDATVLKYATDMEEGRWRYNGVPIIISDDNRIIDGQYRLTALSMQAESASITVLLVTGVKMSAQSTVDINKPRDLAAILTLEDIDHVDSTVAAGIRMFVIWDMGYLFQDTRTMRAHTSKPALAQWAMKNTDVVELLYEARQYDVIPARNGALRAIYAKMVLAQGKSENVDEFFAKLASGIDLQVGSPILALRNRLIKIQSDRIRISDRDLIGFVVKAFNAWRKGETWTKVQRPRGGTWSKDNFPKITAK